jgi:hypothetical protein
MPPGGRGGPVDASVAETNEGRRGHIGARAELDAVSDEVMQLVGMLDGLNRYRFGRDAEMLAAWESARSATRRVGFIVARSPGPRCR